MDLIKLSSTTSYVTELSIGQTVNGWDRVLWVEKYQGIGEFKIEAKLSSGLLDFLPIGSFISHVQTREVMMVENHEIDQPKGEDGDIVISGRSLVGYLENRTIGDWHTLTFGNERKDYTIAMASTYIQIVDIILDHFMATDDPDNNLPGMYAGSSISSPSTQDARTIKVGTVYERILELLKIDDYGIRTLRPEPADALTYFDIYEGADKSDSVRFSWLNGDLGNVKYFFSNRKKKNYARVVGRWVDVHYELGTNSKFDRRIMLIDGTDLDSPQSVMPTGTALTWIVAAMTIRAKEALAAQNDIVMTSVDVSDDVKAIYRKDYNLGDLVTVEGNFGVSQVMRVTEYAETADETGTTGNPTLSIPGGS